MADQDTGVITGKEQEGATKPIVQEETKEKKSSGIPKVGEKKMVSTETKVEAEVRRVIVEPIKPRTVRIVWASCIAFLILGISIIIGALRIPIELEHVSLESGKTFIVVGCAPGNVELESALLLLEMGATTVICTIEDKDSGEQIKKAVSKYKHKGVMIVETMDPRSLVSVENFARKINERPGFIDGVTLNWGIYTPHKQITKDGFDEMYQVNFLSQFLLLRLIEGKFSRDVHVVFLSSTAYLFDGKLDTKAYSSKPGGRNHTMESRANYFTYADTKLFQILLAREYATRWKDKYADSLATFNAVCPGVVGPIAPVTLEDGLFNLVKYMVRRILERTPREAAIPGVMIQTSPKFKALNGTFIPSYIQLPLSQHATKKTSGARLWRIASNLLNIPENQAKASASI